MPTHSPDDHQAASLSNAHEIERISPHDLILRENSPRKCTPEHLEEMKGSIEAFKLNGTVEINGDNIVLAGVARVRAARELGFDTIDCVRYTHLTPVQERAYALKHNKMAEKAGFNTKELALEFDFLINTGFDLELTGFSVPEIDLIMVAADEADEESSRDGDDALEQVAEAALDDPIPPVVREGDVFVLGRHRLICGNARSEEHLDRLMNGRMADCVLTDAPYNAKINGHVSGLGRTKHQEFAEASGEMTDGEFTEFLSITTANITRVCKLGAIAFMFMDWRHQRNMLDSGEASGLELKMTAVWNKTNAGMGTFYRSQHEFVYVWKIPGAKHRNNFGLGDTGRYRTNVWTFAGANTFSKDRMKDLASHPTVKPVALLVEAILDVTIRGEIVLDPFAGSGSTLIAAQRCGRAAYVGELDPQYCELIIRRWQAMTGQEAVHEKSGKTFDRLKIEEAGWRKPKLTPPPLVDDSDTNANANTEGTDGRDYVDAAASDDELREGVWR